MITIAGRRIGPGEPVFLQVEAGVTHNGRLGAAIDLAGAAHLAGADAIKFQCIDPDAILASEAMPFTYGTAQGPVCRPIGDVLREVATFTEADWEKLFAACVDIGIIAYCTVDHEAGVDLMERLGVPAYKLSSWDLAHIPLLDRMVATGKPVLIDVGSATRAEVLAALPDEHGDDGRLFIHAPHPTASPDWNLCRVRGFFRPDYPFGFSSPGRPAWPDFVALAGGACLIEKRLTLDMKNPRGHHHAISLEPAEFAQWASDIRRAERALAEDPFSISPAAARERQQWGRSVVAARDLPAGTLLAPEDLACKRPGGGIAPAEMALLVGCTLAHAMARNELFTWNNVRRDAGSVSA